MSHIVEATTKITCPDLPAFLALSKEGAALVAHLPFLALLREAVTLVAHEHSGTIQPHYLDYSRQIHPVNTGLALTIAKQADTSKNLERGIGLVIDEQSGVLKFVGDPHRVEALFEQVQRQIVQRYVGLAYTMAMRQLQYQTSSQVVEDRLIVSGVSYA